MKQLSFVAAALLLITMSADAVTVHFKSVKPLKIKVNGFNIQLEKANGNYTGSIKELEPGKTYVFKTVDDKNKQLNTLTVVLKSNDVTYKVGGNDGAFSKEK